MATATKKNTAKKSPPKPSKKSPQVTETAAPAVSSTSSASAAAVKTPLIEGEPCPVKGCGAPTYAEDSGIPPKCSRDATHS